MQDLVAIAIELRERTMANISINSELDNATRSGRATNIQSIR
jgi:hypothetical protein